MQGPVRTKHRQSPSLLRTHCGRVIVDPGARARCHSTARHARTALVSAAALVADGALPEYVTCPPLQKRVSETGEVSIAMQLTMPTTKSLYLIARVSWFTAASLARPIVPWRLWGGRLFGQSARPTRSCSPLRERAHDRRLLDRVLIPSVHNLDSCCVGAIPLIARS